MTQSLITDYFPRVVVTGNDLTLYVTVQDQEHAIGELELYEDEDGRYWVNHVDVNVQWQRRGLGRFLVEHASKQFGTIHFSKQANHEAQDNDDTRHLSVEGAALCRSCVNHNLDVVYCHPNEFREGDDSDSY